MAPAAAADLASWPARPLPAPRSPGRGPLRRDRGRGTPHSPQLAWVSSQRLPDRRGGLGAPGRTPTRAPRRGLLHGWVSSQRLPDRRGGLGAPGRTRTRAPGRGLLRGWVSSQRPPNHHRRMRGRSLVRADADPPR